MKKALRRITEHLRRHLALWFGLSAFFVSAWFLTGTSCTFHATLGLPCPGCGLTRAMLTALRGDLAGAFRLHPLFWLAPLVILSVLALLAFAPEKLDNRLLTRSGLAIAVLFMVVYIIRMILYFPDQDPLVWNSQALMPRLWTWLRSLVLSNTGSS